MNNHFHYYVNLLREMDLVIFLITLSSVFHIITYGEVVVILFSPPKNQYFHNSFTYKVTHLWNKLPTYIKQSPNLNAFHNDLEAINLLNLRTSCLCNYYQS